GVQTCALPIFDHPQSRDRLRRIPPVPAQTAARLAEQAATFVVAQGLQGHAGGAGDLPRAKPAAHAAAPEVTRAASPSSTAVRVSGTDTSNATAVRRWST